VGGSDGRLMGPMTGFGRVLTIKKHKFAHCE